MKRTNVQTSEQRTYPMWALAVVIMVGALIGLWLSPGRGYAAEPYGGCDEAWQAPHSPGADDCRAAGWTVHRRVVLNPHRVVRYMHMRECKFEDGSGSRKPCVWWGGMSGNGEGLSFWVGKAEHFHYFWSPAPTWDGKHRWVTSSEGDAYAEGDSKGATTRNWRACVVPKEGTAKQVSCPDGMVTP